MVLAHYYTEDKEIIEIGVDEVGRGPMFGRVYCAAVVLPKDDSFKHENMKDSKKFNSKKKIEETSEYIKENCLYYEVAYEDEKSIDKNNIKSATYIAMHKAIKSLLLRINNNKNSKILVDGNDFKPLTYMDKEEECIKEVSCACIVGGDNKYTAIAAASILAKVERDKYIYDMCEKYPLLNEYYDLLNNKGYGTLKHMEGIRKHGITSWHRKSFGICKDSEIITIPKTDLNVKYKPESKILVRPTLKEVYDKVIEISKNFYSLPKTANKGKPGIFLEELTGIPKSSDCLDCLDGEVKVFPLKKLKNGDIVPKESIAVTMLSKESLEKDIFVESRCFKKLEKTLYVPYLRTNDQIIYMKPSIIDLSLEKYKSVFEILKNDYDDISQYYLESDTLDNSSKIGVYLQNRTKGAGKDAPKTRAFYLRPKFMKDLIIKETLSL